MLVTTNYANAVCKSENQFQKIKNQCWQEIGLVPKKANKYGRKLVPKKFKIFCGKYISMKNRAGNWYQKSSDISTMAGKRFLKKVWT